MVEILGFDPKTLSNDELFKKQVDLAGRRMAAARLGRLEIAALLENMIQAIDYERRERMYLDRFNSLPTSPVMIETDPSLRDLDTAAEETVAQQAPQPTRPVRRAVRSSKPINPSDGAV